MKNLKKLAGILLALVMVFALTANAFAANGENDNSGVITINNAVVGETYGIYKILVLESYNTETPAYVYKAAPAWEAWLRTQTAYVSFDAQGYVTWTADTDDDTVQAFAKAAYAYAKANAIAPTTSETANSVKVEFTGLNLGYYLVDTSLGTLCSLDTTNTSVEIMEKNTTPTITKEVKEDSTGAWGAKNDDTIGETIYFKTTVNANKGAQNYVVHDEMSAGLTLNQDSIVIKVGDTTLVKDTDYTVAYNVAHKDDAENPETVTSTCDFEITFTQTYLDTITQDTVIVITYDAILNDLAVIYDAKNTNDTWLDYGDDSTTEKAHTDTYAYKFDIVKTNSAFELLDGAEFKLYDAAADGKEIALILKNGVYRVATAEEKAAEGFAAATIVATNGRATIEGLDGQTTYYLEETNAPDGYNILPARVPVVIVADNLTTAMEGTTWAQGDGGVQITNNTGTEMPSTGGIGTTIFYVLGSVLALAAIVLLISKKRMNAKG